MLLSRRATCRAPLHSSNGSNRPGNGERRQLRSTRLSSDHSRARLWLLHGHNSDFSSLPHVHEAAPGGIRIMINHRALAWSGEVPLRAHFDTIACLASVLKFERCSPFRFWKNYINRICIRFTCTTWVLDGLLSSSRPTKGECHLSSECHRGTSECH